MLGVPPEPSFEGKTLVPELLGGAVDERDIVCDLPMTSDNDKRRALVHDKLKIIAFGKDEIPKLFDLEKDPGELSPITKGEQYDEMVKRYRAMSKTVKEVPPTSCNVGCLNREYANKK